MNIQIKREKKFAQKITHHLQDLEEEVTRDL
jgi:hypothetical protein